MSGAEAGLETSLCGIRLRNPVLAASGTFGYGVEFERLADLNALGGLVVKGLSREPMDGNAPPRLWETRAGMMNSIGLQNIGVRAFVRDKMPALSRLRTAVFANIFGYTADDYVEVARVLESVEGLSGYELNVSCPNTRHGGIYFSSDPALLAEVVEAVKRVARRPIIVKLSPNVASIEPLARAAEERRGRDLAGEHFYRTGDRCAHAASAPGCRVRRALGTRNQASGAAPRIPGCQSGKDSGDRPGRHRHRRGCGGVSDRRCECGRSRHGDVLGSTIAGAGGA